MIAPIDNIGNKHLFLNGLGLIKNCCISVNFTKWDEEKNLKTTLARTHALVMELMIKREYILKMEFFH